MALLIAVRLGELGIGCSYLIKVTLGRFKSIDPVRGSVELDLGSIINGHNECILNAVVILDVEPVSHVAET